MDQPATSPASEWWGRLLESAIGAQLDTQTPEHRWVAQPVDICAAERKGNPMGFIVEQTGYQKTILSDLQGAWMVFRQSVVDSGGFKDWERVLFHADEAMSWETVRNLNRMP